MILRYAHLSPEYLEDAIEKIGSHSPGNHYIQSSLLVSYCAEVAELADALDSGSSGRKAMGVQVPPSAPYLSIT